MKKFYFLILVGMFWGLNKTYAQKGQTQAGDVTATSSYDFLVSIPKITEKTYPVFMAEVQEMRGIQPQYYCQRNQVFAFQVDTKFWRSRKDVLQRFKANRLNLVVYEKDGNSEDLLNNCQTEVIKVQ